MDPDDVDSDSELYTEISMDKFGKPLIFKAPIPVPSAVDQSGK